MQGYNLSLRGQLFHFILKPISQYKAKVLSLLQFFSIHLDTFPHPYRQCMLHISDICFYSVNDNYFLVPNGFWHKRNMNKIQYSIFRYCLSGINVASCSQLPSKIIRVPFGSPPSFIPFLEICCQESIIFSFEKPPESKPPFTISTAIILIRAWYLCPGNIIMSF